MRKPKPKSYQLIRGMKDVLPQEDARWDLINKTAEKLARSFGYEYIETPILEDTNLFVRSVGEHSDIVEKEMFSFTDKGGDNVSMRPEGTAPIIRSYIEHGMIREMQPVRMWYSGPFFRYDRPQAGRYRQFHQFGYEAIGEIDPIIDAEILLMTNQFFKKLEIPISIQINSNGHSECRTKFIKAFQEYARSKRSMLCEDCKKRLLKNPMRIIDCKEEGCQTVASSGPQIVDHLCEDCRTHFTRVLEYCDEVNIPYVLNPRIVRGLDYYTKTTFEVWAEGDQEAAQMSLGGGGRYDGLAEDLGGRYTPAIGAALGLERISLKLIDRQIQKARPDIFICQLGEKARRKCLGLIDALTNEGMSVVSALSKSNLKNQLEIANKKAAKFVLILGQKEIVDETIMLRDMDAGAQELLDFKKAVEEVKKRVQTYGVLVKDLKESGLTPHQFSR